MNILKICASNKTTTIFIILGGDCLKNWNSYNYVS